MAQNEHHVRRARGFTLIELLVAVSIMVVMVLALYQMFHQTQRALRSNLVQVDVLESGRAALDMISRELEQMAACNYSNTVNLYTRSFSQPPSLPAVQYDLDEKTAMRTNVLHEFFFLVPQSNVWSGIGYRVMQATNGVGTLYRFERSMPDRFFDGGFLRAAFQAETDWMRSTNLHRLAEGVVHIRLQAYDPNGHLLAYYTTNMYPLYRTMRFDGRGAAIPRFSNAFSDTNVIVRAEAAAQSQLLFLSNAVPAYVDFELGVLETGTYIRYQSILEGSTAAAQEFLRKQANKVHLFRKRIPIRTVTQ